MHDFAFVNANLATGTPIKDGVVAITGERISWVGPRAQWHDKAHEEHDARGAWITPGLIDCHTHLVYAGNRAHEFDLRLKGATYEEIARAGGGILSTVIATRQASEEELLAAAERRLRQWAREGATVIEVKSGYGLDHDTELKMLRVARRLSGLTVRTTFLGAHALPPEYKGRADDYIELVCDTLARAHSERLVDAVDAFCERIAFTPEQTRRVFQKANSLGLPVKLHADQLSDSGGAALAAEYRALSADHLEHANEQGIAAMRGAGTVAVLLPGAFYFLREKQLPPIGALRGQGVSIAIATDHNPGTSPLTSPPLALNMACTLFRLTPEEALAGMTRNAARALGLSTHGSIEVGKQADLALWDVATPAELCYAIGANPCAGVMRNGAFRPAVT